ncbi:MAG: response regulator [Methylobacteriaceae bacterium]|nr:response regulator [Methylobacteriaceae bacterium]
MALTDGEPPSPRRVLVVEDEALIRVLLVCAFEDEGFDVAEAASADEALDILATLPTPPLAIVTDIRMPGRQDGLALAGWARVHLPRTVVVVTSGYTAEPPALATGRETIFLPKPYEPADVVALIRRLDPG